MKKIIQLTLMLLICIGVYAQAPEAFKYQAVVRDASGSIIANQSVSFQISILQNSATGSSVYTETHTLNTNDYGLANMVIGNGTLVSGNFSTIDWSNDNYFVQVEFDPTGGSNYTLMGTSQLLSVPYALNAKTADNVFDGDYNSLSNTPTNVSAFNNDAGYVTTSNDGDTNSTNELQTLSLASDTLALSNSGGTVSLTPYLDNTDAQTLSLNSNDLSISNGNTIDLSTITTNDLNWNVNGSHITNANAGYVGIGTVPVNVPLTVKTVAANGIQVTNGTGSTINLNANTGTPGNPYILMSDGTESTMLSQLTTGNFVIDSYSGPPYQFEMEQNGTGTGIYIDAASNVGVGTTSPSAKLEVNGQVKITGGSPGTGKVLTSDASGLATWQSAGGGVSEEFRAVLGSGGTYSQSGQVIIFNSEDYDPGNNYNPSTGVYTVPSTGLYTFTVQRYASFSGGGSMVQVWLRKNGSYHTVILGESGAFGNVQNSTVTLQLTAGDLIDMYHVGGNATTSYTGGACFFEGRKLK